MLTEILLVLQAGVPQIFSGKCIVKDPSEQDPNIGAAEMMSPCYLAKHLFKQILDIYNEQII